MKRIFLKLSAVALLLTASVTANAQISLSSVLNKVSSAASSATSSTKSSSSSTGSLISGLTSIFSSNKVAKASDLVGTWSYEEPAVVFTSENALSNLGGKAASSVIEKKLQTQLSKYGITKGKMTMTFDKDGNFTQNIGGRKLTGTYTLSDKNVVLKYGGTVSQIVGTTQVDGNSLLIVMDASKLLKYASTLGSLSGNSTLKTASSLLGNMDGMECGLRLKK
ncbi:MAG: lipocalin-like domain-containing protein [Prevotella sp.]|jgi:hypothetical protein